MADKGKPFPADDLERILTGRGCRDDRQAGVGERGDDTFCHELGLLGVDGSVGIVLVTIVNGRGHDGIDLMLIRHGMRLRSSNRSMSLELMRRRAVPVSPERAELIPLRR